MESNVIIFPLISVVYLADWYVDVHKTALTIHRQEPLLTCPCSYHHISETGQAIPCKATGKTLKKKLADAFTSRFSKEIKCVAWQMAH